MKDEVLKEYYELLKELDKRMENLEKKYSDENNGKTMLDSLIDFINGLPENEIIHKIEKLQKLKNELTNISTCNVCVSYVDCYPVLEEPDFNKIQNEIRNIKEKMNKII